MQHLPSPSLTAAAVIFVIVIACELWGSEARAILNHQRQVSDAELSIDSINFHPFDSPEQSGLSSRAKRFANKELELTVRKMLAKMSIEEIDNTKMFCDKSSDKMRIHPTQKRLIMMCIILGYKITIAEVKPKRSLPLSLERVNENPTILDIPEIWIDV
ncbi:hypothetical protein PENTCL1PPCAC_615 [Pristionchus entomophagus]|uniref:Uncharacterized protein n=1 Tax=Pristionchus entomophagus TaxID=358040 RepID=A0AAV5S7J4_9BILA|nr:hypothetical protein PENTCL1PPCAC_615 [Pristionchus entomophagus]